MGTEPSSNSNNAPPSSSAFAESFVGSFISVTSKSGIRYEGVLYYLNPSDSTFGLKDVRSYGSEGRRKDGQEVPPSDKVFEYILFRGSDIKDIKVITISTPQKEEEIYSDPAIIQSNYDISTSSSSKSMPNIGGSFTESSLYSEPPPSNEKSYPSILPSHQSGIGGLWGSSPLTQTAVPSYGMTTQWPGYSGASGNVIGTQQHSSLSTGALGNVIGTQQQSLSSGASGNIGGTQQYPILSTGASGNIVDTQQLSLLPTGASGNIVGTQQHSLSSGASGIAGSAQQYPILSSGASGNAGGAQQYPILSTGASGNIVGTQQLSSLPTGLSGNFVGTQHSLLSTPMLYPFQNQATTTMGVSNISHNVPIGSSLTTASSFFINATPTLTSELLTLPSVDSLSPSSSQTLHRSTLINSNGLTLPFSLPYQNASTIEAPVVNKVVVDHVPSLPSELFPHSLSSVSHPVSDFSLRQQLLLTPNLSQPKLSVNVCTDPKDMDAMSSTSLKFSCSSTTPASQPPLLPLPPASQKLQPPVEFNEEFDFQAMNDKFKKDEVWGYLGKTNHRENVDLVQNASSSEDSGDNYPDMTSNSDPKPAYNKDDFFDNISCNSSGRGARGGYNRLSERMKLDSETFGNFQRRIEFGYGNRGGRGQNRNPYGWGRGYYYNNRGRGRYI